MPFAILWNAGIDHDPPKKVHKVAKVFLPNFSDAVKDPNMAVQFVLRQQRQKKAEWWKMHARLAAPDVVPCNTLCEIIKVDMKFRVAL